MTKHALHTAWATTKNEAKKTFQDLAKTMGKAKSPKKLDRGLLAITSIEVGDFVRILFKGFSANLGKNVDTAFDESAKKAKRTKASKAATKAVTSYFKHVQKNRKFIKNYSILAKEFKVKNGQKDFFNELQTKLSEIDDKLGKLNL